MTHNTIQRDMRTQVVNLNLNLKTCVGTQVDRNGMVKIMGEETLL